MSLSSLVGCGGDDKEGAPTGATYVALGDSDSAGAGIAPVVDTDCLRSRVNYPSLVAQRLGHDSFEDMTCAGAATTNLQRPQFTKTASNDPQLDPVGSRTQLVTLTLGLNDKKLAFNLFGACLAPGGEPTPVCEQVLEVPQETLDGALAEAADRVEDALRLIRNRAPEARIILVGYPRFFPDTGDCPDRVPMVEAMVTRLRDALAEVNVLWKQAAERVGVDYLDTHALTEGHDVCSDDPWINGAEDAPGEASALHPFAAFHRAVAVEIVELLEK